MIAIVGRGNVASHLFNALKDKTEVILINPHSLENFPDKADLVIIAVADDAISDVAKRIPSSDAIIAHTSGSVSMDTLEESHSSYGVLYPLQTFSKDLPLDYKEIPVFIEGNNADTIKKLSQTASLFSNKVGFADSVSRKKLHLASVFACNFSNALAGVASEILKDAGMEFSVLLPLLKQTVGKLESVKPAQAQTGPAKRGDVKILRQHLDMLENRPILKEIYQDISKIINPDLIL